MIKNVFFHVRLLTADFQIFVGRMRSALANATDGRTDGRHTMTPLLVPVRTLRVQTAADY